MIHNYFIDFDFTGEVSTVNPYRGGRQGHFSVYSEEEISPKKLHEILVDVTLHDLPRGLPFLEFEKQVYSALEKRGLKKIRDIWHNYGQNIRYNSDSIKETFIQEKVPSILM